MDGFHLLDPGRAKPGDPGSLVDVSAVPACEGAAHGSLPALPLAPGSFGPVGLSMRRVLEHLRDEGALSAVRAPVDATACLSCHQWSLHEDWYERGTDPGAGA